MIANPEKVESPKLAALSAAWFWESRGLNILADDNTGEDDLEDFARMTKKSTDQRGHCLRDMNISRKSKPTTATRKSNKLCEVIEYV